MRRGLVLRLGLGVFVLATLAGDAFPRKPRAFSEEKYLRFVDLVDSFHRRYIGCPEKGFPPAIACEKGRRTLDWALYRELSRYAPEVFPLPDAKMVPEGH